MTIASVGSVAAASVLWWGALPTGWFFAGPFRFREAAVGPTARHLRRSLTQLVVFWTTFFALVPMVAAAIERRLRIEWPVLDHVSLRLVGIVVFLAVAGAVAWDVGIRPVEEADLKTRFGGEYVTYQERVRRWVPRLAPIPRGAVS